MRSSVASAPDPYKFAELEIFDDDGLAHPEKVGNRNTAGKAIRDPRLVDGDRTGVFVIAGQSQTCNRTPTPYTPTNAIKVDNLNIYDGGMYEAVDPLLGCDAAIGVSGNLFTRFADKLVTDDVFDRVILIPVGVGGTSMEEWSPGVLGQRLLVAPRRAAAIGMDVTAFLWMQGENDNMHGTTQSAYASMLSDAINIPRSIGFNAPWLIGKCTYVYGEVSAAVQAAQTAAVNGMDIFAGADTDTLDDSYRQSSTNPHFNDTGAAVAAGLWATAVTALPSNLLYVN